MYLAVQGEGLFLHQLLACGHKEYVVLLQGYVGYASFHDAVDVNGDDLETAVGAHAVHHGMGGEGLFGHSLGMLEQPLTSTMFS